MKIGVYLLFDAGFYSDFVMKKLGFGGGELIAYHELIKDFNKIRDYMRDFYVYGLKSREEYTRKSARTYDDERRRLESWLSDYMKTGKALEGKAISISVDSRKVAHNPLFRAWRTKSFTDGDINLHFVLLDILGGKEEALSFSEIVERVDGYFRDFKEPISFDESTIRKKLKEYVSEGLLLSEKKGKAMYYQLSREKTYLNKEMIDFFSEVLPCGVLGFFLLDKLEKKRSLFRFKHHYITGAMDSEILADLFSAMREKRTVKLTLFSRKKEKETEREVIPLKVRMSVQTGRQYLMAYHPVRKRILSIRIDFILSVKKLEVCEKFEDFRKSLDRMRPHLWGVNTDASGDRRLEEVSFTVCYEKDEAFIHNRLCREKRCGMVEKLSETESRFTARVYDGAELIPWIRSFIGRITELSFSNKRLEEEFMGDLERMYELYGWEEG